MSRPNLDRLVREDPGELDNRIDDSSYADAVRNLRDRTLRWYVETADVVPFMPDRRS